MNSLPKALLLLAPLIMGCFTHHTWVNYDQDEPMRVVQFEEVKPQEHCFQAASGLEVYTNGTATCPPIQLLNEAENELENRLLPVTDLLPSPAGAKVIFIGSFVNCGVATAGCTRGWTMVVSTHGMQSLGIKAGPRDTFQHELGHELRFLKHLDPDPEHTDCKWWSAVNPQIKWPSCKGNL